MTRRRILLAVTLLLAVAIPAYADMIMPLAIGWPWVILAFVPGVLLEAVVLTHFLKGLDFASALRVSFLMNLVSSVSGAVLLLVGLLPFSVLLLRFIDLIPPRLREGLFVLGVMLITFAFTVLIESVIARQRLPDRAPNMVNRAVFLGNVLTYLLVSSVFALPAGSGPRACEAIDKIASLFDEVFSNPIRRCEDSLGSLEDCSAGTHGIPPLPPSSSLPYVKALSLQRGVLLAELALNDRSGTPLLYSRTYRRNAQGWTSVEAGTAVSACRDRLAYKWGFWSPF
jgi:hypothetical protein